MDNFPEILETNAAAKLCGFTRQRIHQLLTDGRFPEPDVKVGRHPFWHRATIYGFLDTWTSAPGSSRKGKSRSEALSPSSGG